MTRWPDVPLRDLLEKSDAWIRIDPSALYKEVRACLWGKGLELRGVLEGSEIASTRRLEVRAHQFLVSRIDARHGAVGLIPEELDGAVVSNDYPVFNINEDRILPAYLGWYAKTSAFVEACRQASEGTTNRVRLQERRFLEVTVPLPPPIEQQRVVKQLERLSGYVDSARDTHLGAQRDLLALQPALLRQAFGGREKTHTLGQLCSTVIDCLHSNPVYSDSGIPTVRSPDVGWGELKLSTARRTTREEYVRRTQRGEPQPGDMIVVREGGGTGRAALVPEGEELSLGQRVVILRPNSTLVDPRFLLLQWLSPTIQEDLIVPQTKGSASPHLNISALKQFPYAVPPLDEQRRLVDKLDELLNRVTRVRHHAVVAESLLAATMPSILTVVFGSYSPHGRGVDRAT